MELADAFDSVVLLRFADLAVEGLASSREEIDALNVYPVADADTGTNMYLTMDAARDAVLGVDLPADGDERAWFRDCLAIYVRGALVGARGNSGVILSQLLQGLLSRIGAAEMDEPATRIWSEGAVSAADAAYAAVGDPVEGTMLTVARAAANGASTAAAAPDAKLGDVVSATAAAAREALLHTPEQLDVLRNAGVVDAGAFGLCVVLDAAVTAFTGRRPEKIVARPAPASLVPTGDLTEDGPSYEVMYLLDAHDGKIDDLRKSLLAVGDSVVVVGGDELWNVHVHTDDVGAAVELGIDAGRPHRIRVTHFVEQLERDQARRAASRVGRAVAAVAVGEGLHSLFRDAGATVIEASTASRATADDFRRAIEESGAAEVIVLPNAPDTVRLAEAAAEAAQQQHGIRVVVIPTSAQVQGLAALAVHEPSRSLDADVVAMTSAARSTRHGGVTIAESEAVTSAGVCQAGDVLGAIQGDFAIIGDDEFAIATEVLRRLLEVGGEMVTLVSGIDADELAARCEDWVSATYPGTDVLRYYGGSRRYPLLVAVE